MIKKRGVIIILFFSLVISIFCADNVYGGGFNNISAGLQHTCSILFNGTAYCWGVNGFGRLGDGTKTQREEPTPVNMSSTFKAISTGDYYSCGVLSNGTAYCWGRNNNGQLGDGTTTERTNPTPINISSTFKAISAGYHHSCGILSNGTAYCWGYNNQGQLGDGTKTQHINPTPVDISSTFKAISTAGYSHSCGILSNGSAYCWGDNAQNQLGDGTVVDKLSPNAVNMSSTFQSISIGKYHSCGVLSNGTAYCWGKGTNGRLGDGTTTNKNNPTPVNISSTFKTISAGYDDGHSCGVLSNGTAYCWGESANGRLGNGDIINDQSNPSPVNISSTFKTISAGDQHSCGIFSNGTAYCWGYNANGQLGDGTTTQRINPTAVNFTYPYTGSAPTMNLGYFDGGDTTNPSSIPDYTDVSDFILHKTSKSKIKWINNVNIDSADLDTNIKMGIKFTSVNSAALNASLNTTANITIYDIDCDNFDLYHASGFYDSFSAIKTNGNKVADQSNKNGDCDDDTICKDVQCSGTTLTFEAQHFDGFGAEEQQEQGAVPEFSTWAMILALIITILGCYSIRKR